MKKILSLLTVLSLAASCSLCAAAADKEKGEPDVYVDGNRIVFSDQNATIVDGRTLVPARGVFEAMDCKVKWDGDTREVTVKSSTGVQSVVITIDSDKMKILKYKSLLERTEDEVTLDVPAQIMNDRTMIPLRAVSEAFDCNVEWDSENYKVDITTGDPILLDGYTYKAPDEETLVSMSLFTDKTGKLEAGEEFTVYVDADNIPADSFCSGVVATFEFDKSKFEYVEGSGTLLNDNGDEVNAAVFAENTGREGGTKVIFATIDETNAATSSGHVFKATFKSINGEAGSIEIGKTYESTRGHGSYLMFTTKSGENVVDTIYEGKNLVIDAPITIGE
ncbi:MAG: hypothetical protein IJH37_11150 [Clostridia bacterium]|nr:hypothetical protein [Clostridia bacterium]